MKNDMHENLDFVRFWILGSNTNLIFLFLIYFFNLEINFVLILYKQRKISEIDKWNKKIKTFLHKHLFSWKISYQFQFCEIDEYKGCSSVGRAEWR